MSRGNEPAYPGEYMVSVPNMSPMSVGRKLITAHARGMTLREHFAGLAMQGLLGAVTDKRNMTHSFYAEQAVKAADALIAELSKEPTR